MTTEKQTPAELANEINQDILHLADHPCLAVHRLQTKVDRLRDLASAPQAGGAVPPELREIFDGLEVDVAVGRISAMALYTRMRDLCLAYAALASPVAREPLTDAQIDMKWAESGATALGRLDTHLQVRELVRAVERTHGILAARSSAKLRRTFADGTGDPAHNPGGSCVTCEGFCLEPVQARLTAAPAAPVAREPLSGDQIRAAAKEADCAWLVEEYYHSTRALIRAVEACHNITPKEPT